MSKRPMDILTLAAATGSTGGLGKITTEPASGVLIVRFDCAPNTYAVHWIVRCDKAHAVQTYIAQSNVLGATITGADATAIDDGDNFVLNGLTFKAESTEGDAKASERKFWTGANNAAAVANLAALITHATYGVPGISATVAAVDATDVITISAETATVLQFGQGTSAADEVAWSNTTLTSLIKDSAAVTGVTANNTTAGTLYRQVVYGCPYAYLAVTNSDGAAAATIIVKATAEPWV
jgi:hypothetical protein